MRIVLTIRSVTTCRDNTKKVSNNRIDSQVPEFLETVLFSYIPLRLYHCWHTLLRIKSTKAIARQKRYRVKPTLVNCIH